MADTPPSEPRHGGWLRRDGSSVILPGGNRIRFTTALALLYVPASFLRGMMIALMPLLALEILGTAQKVSVLYTVVGAGGISIALLLPRLVPRIGSRGVFALGGAAGVASMCLLPFGNAYVFLAGMLLHVFAVASFEMALILFLMGELKRDEYKFFESYRVLGASSGFVVGPILAIFLRDRVWAEAPFVLTALFVLVAVVYARSLGLGDTKRTGPTTSTANPIAYLRRFFSQPRLLLAWSLSLTRYGWWMAFYIYVPIYVTSSGLDALVAGAMVSVAMLSSWMAPLWAMLGRRYGLRTLYITGFVGCGILSLVAYAVSDRPVACAVTLLLAALFSNLPDGASHIPFYRATRVRERAEMSGVYVTHRDTGQLFPPAVFSLLLKVFPLPVVFVVTGGMMLVAGYFCRHLPRRM